MGIFNIFKRKPKAESEQVVGTIATIEQPEPSTEVRGECWWCHKDVTMDERYSKQQGKLFHKKCYQQAKSNAKGMGMGS